MKNKVAVQVAKNKCKEKIEEGCTYQQEYTVRQVGGTLCLEKTMGL